MRHDLTLEGPGFRLRPVGDDDAQFILGLRTDPALGRFLHATSSSIGGQLAWMSRYYERPGDYYFVVEQRKSLDLEGVIAVYDLDSERRSAEWGRWILRHGSLAAVESALLIYRAAFDTLKLDETYSRTVADNQAVVSFHDSCGIESRKILPGHFDIAGKRVDAVEHRLHKTQWAAVEQRLASLATLTARRLSRG